MAFDESDKCSVRCFTFFERVSYSSVPFHKMFERLYPYSQLSQFYYVYPLAKQNPSEQGRSESRYGRWKSQTEKSQWLDERD